MSFKLITLLRKDLHLEMRSKESISLLFGLAVLLSLVAMFAISSSFLPAATILRIAPGLAWMIFLFVATTALGRCFEPDLKARALDALILIKAPLALIYTSKVMLFSALLLLTHCLTLLLLAGLLEINLFSLSST